MEFEWDNKKNGLNLEKHGLAFEDAELVFAGQCVHFRDERLDYGESRYITLGQLKGRTVIIVHTPREDRTRLISMRKANERETKIYKQRLKTNR